MTSEDKKDAARYIPNLWHSLVQVIIQSRLGEKAFTESKSPSKGSTMFNVEFNVIEEITQTIKRYMGSQTLAPDNPFSVEILLRTKDGESMVLEVWTLSMEENVDCSSQKICQITDRMSILLKSAICVSRITPAFALSFRQSSDTFIILYRLYNGKPCVGDLGERPTQLRVGQTNVQSSYLSIHLTYRTVLTLPSQRRNLHHDQMMLKSDYFKFDSSPKHQRRVSERVSDSTEAAQTSDESQDATRLPFPTHADLHSNPRSRTSSESSNRGPRTALSSEKIYVPFANYAKPPSLEEYLLPDDTPYPNLLMCPLEKIETTEEEKGKGTKERKLTNVEVKTSAEQKVTEKSQMNSSDHSNKSFASNTTKDDEYVLVDLKTPFADAEVGDVELGNFFKEWQAAPPLKMFSDAFHETESSSDSLQLNDQIKTYENCAEEYEELVKSLHLEDLTSSQELG